MLVCLSLLLPFTFVPNACVTSKPPSSALQVMPQRPQTSDTYPDTVRMVKAWHETEESDELGRLFAIGDLRTPDLLRICHDSDDEIAVLAFMTLRLLGQPECMPCGDAVFRKHKHVPFVCGTSITDADSNRIEQWLAKKKNGNRYDCGPKDKYEPLTPLDDSVIYALILDGSVRSKLILNGMLAVEKACVAQGTTIIGEIVSQADSLIEAAKDHGHNLEFEPNTLERVVRSSAFFLPAKFRKDSEIKMIAHNKADSRILLEVSFWCGRLCGAGYYVVLQRNGNTWGYASIGMAWIS